MSHQEAFWRIEKGRDVCQRPSCPQRIAVTKSHAAARGWSTAGWCNWSTAGDWRTARLWRRAAWFTASAAEALFEHPGKQSTTWFAAWIAARFRFTAWLRRTTHRCWSATSRSRCTTWLGLRAARVATGGLWLEAAKQAGFGRLRSNETAQNSHGKQRKNTSH